MFKIVHSETGKVEYLHSKRELEDALPVDPSSYRLIMKGETVKLASFMGQVEVSLIRRR